MKAVGWVLVSLALLATVDSCFGGKSIREPKSVLIFGGTQLLGSAIVETLLNANHRVSIVSRRVLSEEESMGAAVIVAEDRGNKAEVLAALEDHGPFDAVVDNSAFIPVDVAVATKVAEHVNARQYILISTMSVYSTSGTGITESANIYPPAYEPQGDTSESYRYRNYGRLKAGCEEMARKFTGVVTILRPSVIAGPRDKTGRFPYMVQRFLNPKPSLIAAPEHGGHVQLAYSRDIGNWIAKSLLYEVHSDVYNAAGKPVVYADYVRAIGKALDEKGLEDRVVWGPDSMFRECEWRYLPMFLLKEHDTYMDTFKATKAGYIETPLGEMAAQMGEWLSGREGGRNVEDHPRYHQWPKSYMEYYEPNIINRIKGLED